LGRNQKEEESFGFGFLPKRVNVNPPPFLGENNNSSLKGRKEEIGTPSLERRNNNKEALLIRNKDRKGIKE